MVQINAVGVTRRRTTTVLRLLLRVSVIGCGKASTLGHILDTTASTELYGNGGDWWPFGSPATPAQSSWRISAALAGYEPSPGFGLSRS